MTDSKNQTGDEHIRIPHITGIQDYESIIGAERLDRICKKAEGLKDFHVTNVNSTYYGGGVAEILKTMTLLMNSLGIRTGWRTIIGDLDFFDFTKNMHNALQSGNIVLTEKKKKLYEETVRQNAMRMHLDHDLVVVHDPQPLPLINFYERSKNAWIWRCHIDMSHPHTALWDYLKQFVSQFDSVIFSIEEYAQDIDVPMRFFLPAIDPFAYKNVAIAEREIKEKLSQYKIPADLPILCQVSRFDIWKDPEGVIQAFRKARKEVQATLVMLGNSATDDPEGQQVFESLQKYADERTLIMDCGDDIGLVNALQTASRAVIQKSIREGFGLTVTEAMWKGTPVIGGNVGGIKYQIVDGENGYLVNSVDEAAERMVAVVQDESLAKKLGEAAKETVRKNFLMTRLLEQYLDLFTELKEKIS